MELIISDDKSNLDLMFTNSKINMQRINILSITVFFIKLYNHIRKTSINSE